MTNYKEMYLQMYRATEKAINILIEAQKEAEEQFISSSDPELIVLSEEVDIKEEN